MPKAIEQYRKVAEQEAENHQRYKVGLIPILILLVLTAFVIKTGMDSWDRISSQDSSAAEKAKICMGEFTELRCNSLDLTSPCKRIFDCVQAGGKSLILAFGEAISEEMLTDFPFPMVIVGLLLLSQLKGTLHNQINPGK